jgi:molybdate transport system ATP-binding protein
MTSHSARHRPYLEVALSSIRLRLAGRSVLNDLSWRIRPGERWVLIGANGAGKTQLMKMLAGDVWPTPGGPGRRIYRWRGERLDEPHGVKEQIAYLGAERQDRYEHYQWNHRVAAIVGTGLYRTDIPLNRLTAADRGRIHGLLEQLGILPLAQRRFLTLSYGQRRLVLLARALAWRPALLLMDELLNGLDDPNRQRVLRLIHQLRHRSLPWVLATHRIEDIPPSATHLARLTRGRLSHCARLDLRQRRSRAAPRRTARRAPAQRARAGEPLLALRNGWVWLDGQAVLRHLNFQIHPGDCWLVHGPNGSGKSTLLRALYGDIGVASQGQIRRRGIEAGVPISEFKRRVGLIAPELQATLPLYLTVVDVVVSGLYASVGLDELPSPVERRQAMRALARLGAARLASRTLRELSYGQLRRVLFARAWVREPDILLLDEPFAGLDVSTRKALARRIHQAILDGVTIVMVTHDRRDWPAGATHELQLRAGEAAYCGVMRFQ